MHVLTSMMTSLVTSLVLSPVAGERLAGSLRDCCVIKKDVRIPTRIGRLQHSLQQTAAPSILMDVNINNILH